MYSEKNDDKDVAMAILGKLYKILHIKPECSSIFDRGFIWYDNFCTQRVWASDPSEFGDALETKVHVETDFLKIPMKAPDLMHTLAFGMRCASLSGPVFYPLAVSIKLRSSVSVDLENQYWTLPLLCLSAWNQYREAALFGEEIVKHNHHEIVSQDYDLTVCNEFVENTFDHFSRLPINSQDDLLTNLPPSFFTEMVKRLKELKIFSWTDGRTLGAYLPFCGGKALLAVSAKEKHALYGEGLLILLSLPPGAISDKPLDGGLILKMNLRDAGSRESGHFLGSWCLGPGEGRRSFTPAFVTFIPAAWCNPILAENLILSAMDRCVWAQNLVLEGISKLEGFNLDCPVAHNIEPHKPFKWPREKSRVPYELVASPKGEKLLDIFDECVEHIIEDICETSCPVDALRTFNMGASTRTCDPHDYARNCGIAELREVYLLRGKEVR
jgi:hypothetical protein